MFKRIKKLFKGEYPLPFLLYKIFTKKMEISKRFPQKFYKILSKKKYAKLGDFNEVLLETYDGLGQVTHPSVIKFGDYYVLAVTPFPYGNDKYENPCLFVSKNGIDFDPIFDAQPLVLPNEHNKLIYLSDPFLMKRDDVLYLIYRECRYRNGEEYTAYIYEMHSNDLKVWSSPTQIFHCDFGAMSPAVLTTQGQEFLYYVVFKGQTTALYRRKYGCDYSESEVEILNMPSDMMLWHIDFFVLENKTYGLFTFSTDFKGDNARTYLAKNCENGSWIIIKEIKLTEKNDIIKKTYKSCAIQIENELYLYVSVRRIDRKWCLYLRKICVGEGGDIIV